MHTLSSHTFLEQAVKRRALRSSSLTQSDAQEEVCGLSLLKITQLYVSHQGWGLACNLARQRSFQMAVQPWQSLPHLEVACPLP